MRRPHLEIEQRLITHEHESFLKVTLSCQHEYYKDGVCTDLALELTPASNAMLKAHGLLYKENGHSILIGRKKTNSDKGHSFDSVLPAGFPKIVTVVKIINPRFLLVTDFDALSEGCNPTKAKAPLLFCNKEEGLSCIGADTTVLKALGKEHFTKVPKDKDEIPIFPKDVFAVVLLNLKQVSDKQASFYLELQAPAVRLRYHVAASKAERKIKPSATKLSITDVLSDGKELSKASTQQEKPIQLQVKHLPEDNLYVLESTGLWGMRQVNEQKTTNFFKFEVEVKNTQKAKEGKAEVFLPFPGRIRAQVLRKEGDIKVIEQKVRLLRFSAKPSPVK
jgi:hypothetical protein